MDDVDDEGVGVTDADVCRCGCDDDDDDDDEEDDEEEDETSRLNEASDEVLMPESMVGLVDLRVD